MGHREAPIQRATQVSIPVPVAPIPHPCDLRIAPMSYEVPAVAAPFRAGGNKGATRSAEIGRDAAGGEWPEIDLFQRKASSTEISRKAGNLTPERAICG